MQQHWLPRAYLAAWCDEATTEPEPYVWVFDREGGVGKAKSPKKLFRQPDLYADASAKRRQWLEYGLQRIEDGFLRVRDRVIARQEPLKEQDIAALIVFTATILVRSPRFRDHMKQPWEHMLRIADEFAAAQRAMTPEQKRNQPPPPRPITTGTTIPIEAARAAAERPLPTLMGPYVRAYTGEVREMGYVLMHTDDKPGFITSDNPCVQVDPDAGQRPPYMRSGLRWPNVEVTLPISPQFAILFSWQLERGGYVEIPEADLNELNCRTRTACHESFIVCQNVTRPAWFEGEAPKDPAGHPIPP
jgi:Protein of unknown function (DUF4238)